MNGIISPTKTRVKWDLFAPTERDSDLGHHPADDGFFRADGLDVVGDLSHITKTATSVGDELFPF